MRLIIKALPVYFTGARAALCAKIFDRRVNRLLLKNAALTDALTISLSDMTWKSALKFKRAEAEFEEERSIFLARGTYNNA